MADKSSEELASKVKKELLPTIRSFTSTLRVAENVWGEGSLIKEYPEEAFTIKVGCPFFPILSQIPVYS